MCTCTHQAHNLNSPSLKCTHAQIKWMHTYSCTHKNIHLQYPCFQIYALLSSVVSPHPPPSLPCSPVEYMQSRSGMCQFTLLLYQLLIHQRKNKYRSIFVFFLIFNLVLWLCKVYIDSESMLVLWLVLHALSLSKLIPLLPSSLPPSLVLSSSFSHPLALLPLPYLTETLQ